ncbi:MAG TPA: DNA polymerase IV [Anaerolineaceae bacterium]|nr:DNA polymerase IV [Anaerolineaceae bacterium]
MERKILHLDLDAFFCSVEELLDPSLRDKPFAVGGNPQGRGVVSSCSYSARRCGVHSAMPMARALALCPDLIVIHHRHGLYSEYSYKVMDILRSYSPLFQQVSIDEAFLDVSDLPQHAEEIAREIQARVDREVQLPCSLGVATNKLVAKIANDFGKSQAKSGQAPRQITVIPPGEEAAFLAPLDIQALWGIGPKTSQKLREQGIHTIGQLAALPIAELEAYFGNNAQEMHARALGIDSSPVRPEREVKSVSNEVTFTRDTTDSELLRRTMRELADKVGFRLRKAGLAGSAVQIKLRYSNFETFTRQTALAQPTDLDDVIYAVAEKLLEENLAPSRPVRLIGVGVNRLSPPYRQLSLWDDDLSQKEKLTDALDQLKEKYGQDVIKRASMMKNPKESDSIPNKS